MFRVRTKFTRPNYQELVITLTRDHHRGFILYYKRHVIIDNVEQSLFSQFHDIVPSVTAVSSVCCASQPSRVSIYS